MKRIIVIQDLCVASKASINVSLPILTAMGMEVFTLPVCFHFDRDSCDSAVDLSEAIQGYLRYLVEHKFHFDMLFVSGSFSVKQLSAINNIVGSILVNDCLFLLNITYNKGNTPYGNDLEAEYEKLCRKANIIITDLKSLFPAYVLQDGVRGYEKESKEAIEKIACSIADKYLSKIVITNIDINESRKGLLAIEDGKTDWLYANKHGAEFPGEADIFAAVFAGAVTKRTPLREAVKLALYFVGEAIKKTLSRSDYSWYGIDFERVLSLLYDKDDS